MKRCIKWLIDKLKNLLWESEGEQVVGFAISGLLGIVLALMFFVSIDKVPATPSDYEQLEKQVNVIQQNPDLLLDTNCTINVNNEIITVVFENDECKVFVS